MLEFRRTHTNCTTHAHGRAPCDMRRETTCTCICIDYICKWGHGERDPLPKVGVLASLIDHVCSCAVWSVWMWKVSQLSQRDKL